MQQACSHCGYESPASARFCRQCGAHLAAETEFSSATTRNYGRQAPPVSAPSAPLPPSVGDAIAGETERYYQPPPMIVPHVSSTAPIKSKRFYWRWLLLVLILFLGIAIGW